MEMNASEQIPDRTQEQTPQDYTWGVTAANWFLIGIGSLIADSSYSGGFAGSAGQFAGRLVAIAIIAAIPVAVIYLAIRDRKNSGFDAPSPFRHGARLVCSFTQF
jgi:hypothetical protein